MSIETLAQHEQSEAELQAIETLAEEFSDNWREARYDEQTGLYEPRIKTTTDEAWIAARGTNQVDIANTEYKDLPADWQQENKEAAQVVIDILQQHNGDVILEDPAVRAEVGARIHDEWLERNEWADGTELDVPFDQLSLTEQEKDIDQIEVAEDLFHN